MDTKVNVGLTKDELEIMVVALKGLRAKFKQNPYAEDDVKAVNVLGSKLSKQLFKIYNMEG